MIIHIIVIMVDKKGEGETFSDISVKNSIEKIEKYK